MKDFKHIEVAISDKLATIWINKPKVKNALNGEAFLELLAALKKLKKSNDCKILMVRGRGEVFSSGADLQWMQESGSAGYRKNFTESKQIAKCMYELYHFPVPTIAVVHGSAFGGALGLIAACDIVLVQNDTKFCFSEVRLGLAPSTIMPYVVKRVGVGNASRLFFTARRFDAAEAKSIGLADLITEEMQTEDTLATLVNDILKASPNAIIECKKMLRGSVPPVSKKIIQKSIGSIASLKCSADGQEGIAAFFEKRAPVWK